MTGQLSNWLITVPHFRHGQVSFSRNKMHAFIPMKYYLYLISSFQVAKIYQMAQNHIYQITEIFK
jgi:hypothetical protein